MAVFFIPISISRATPLSRQTFILPNLKKYRCTLIGRAGSNGPRREKICLLGFANNTGADQPAHPRRLISAFVIRFLERIISKLATSELSIFLLVSVAEETGLNLTLSETTYRFSRGVAQT